MQLQYEAYHLEILNYNFRHWDTISFPKPIFASSSIIIETYELGQISSNIIDTYDSMAHMIHHQYYHNTNKHHHQNNHNNNSTTTNHDELDPSHNVTDIEHHMDHPNDVITSTTTPTLKNKHYHHHEMIIAGHDLIPIRLAKFMVTKGVSLYLKMLLVDNLVCIYIYIYCCVCDCLFRLSCCWGDEMVFAINVTTD